MSKSFDELFASFENKFNHDCIIKECEEHGTKINCSKNKFEHILVFKGEKLQMKLLLEKKPNSKGKIYNGKICDCFIYCTLQNKNSLIASLVELKSGSFNTDEINEKFDNSIKIMEKMIHPYIKGEIIFYPILICNEITVAASKHFSGKRINFRDKSYHIILKRNNENLDLFKIIEEN